MRWKRAGRSACGSSGKADRSSLAVRPVDGLEEGDDVAAVLAGHQRRPVLEDRPEEVLDLEGVVVGRGVDRREAGAVLGLEVGEQVLLAGDGPEVVQRRLGDRATCPAMKVAPRSVSTPTDAPFDPWMWTLV